MNEPEKKESQPENPIPADGEINAPMHAIDQSEAPKRKSLAERQRLARPGVFTKLPSGGKFYKNPPMLNADMEIEVRPMTAVDELKLKNPDGLLNNESLLDVIRACVPAIPDPSEVPSPDLDVIMVALSISTYGNAQEYEIKCPHCGSINQVMKDMRPMLLSFKKIDDDPSVMVGDMEVFVQPYSLKTRQLISDIMMNAQRAAYQMRMKHEQGITDEESIELMQKEMRGMLNDMSEKTFTSLSESVIAVKSDGEMVTDRAEIEEWVHALAAPDANRVKDKVNEIGTVLDSKHELECVECGKTSITEVETNPANFFGGKSSD